MKTALISFTAKGARLCAGLCSGLSMRGYLCEAYSIKKYAKENGLQELSVDLKEWTKKMFREADALLFIGACGIAVRSIAPFVEDKTKDPAVVVLDEKGIFAVSLLSGHLGGANELTGVISDLTGAIPVITTATDVNGRFAVDLFAKKNGLYITDMNCAKAISADVLDEKPVGLKSDFPIAGNVPEEIRLYEDGEVFEGANGIRISFCPDPVYKQTLHLIPKIAVLGIGCRKGKSLQEIEKAVQEALVKAKLPIEALFLTASIDLKAEEEGILDFCRKYRIPFKTYTAEELSKVPGSFTDSEFVKSVTGISNICERSCLLASGNGRLALKKTASDGITVSVALKDWSVEFE